jgi:hypothetical protein
VPLPSHLTSCTPTNYNLYFDIPFAPALSEPAYSPRLKSHIHFLYLRSFIQRIRPGPRFLGKFRKKLILYGDELWAPQPIPKMEDHSLSSVRDCLFNIFAATLQTWRPSPPSATRGRAMPWWQGTHLAWNVWVRAPNYIGVELKLVLPSQVVQLLMRRDKWSRACPDGKPAWGTIHRTCSSA